MTELRQLIKGILLNRGMKRDDLLQLILSISPEILHLSWPLHQFFNPFLPNVPQIMQFQFSETPTHHIEIDNAILNLRYIRSD